MAKIKKVDRPFLYLTLTLTGLGFIIFLSAAMSLLARGNAPFSHIVTTQTVALVLGLIMLAAVSWLHYPIWKKISLPFFLTAVFFCFLLFIPGLGVGYGNGGAVRWLSLGPITFQPAELLKIGFVIYCAAWLSGIEKKIHLPAYGLVPLIMLFAVTGALLLLQPDTNSFGFIVATGVAMFFAAGARIRDVAVLLAAGGVSFLVLITLRPYILDRVLTLFNPEVDILNSGWQIKQSLIAIGSGELWGRGLGQSIQKFTFLPEAIGDSVFAVIGEELGFLGSAAVIALFLALAFRGFQLANRAPDTFSRLLTVGIVILIVGQAFTNIAGMTGIFPLSGTTLPFFSHGGSALIFTLITTGIVLNVSRFNLEIGGRKTRTTT